MSSILEISDMTKNYGNHTALKNISLSIPSGCITGLLGPNGSGKTTLIKIITGLISDYTGVVRINGAAPGVETNKYISYLPDKPYMPDWLTVSDTVEMFSDFYEDFDRANAVSMLKIMEIPMKKRIKALSKGMQEKLQLTLVMSRRAKLYVLDEPIAAVDPAARDFIMRTILSNCAEGSGILLSTHIISDIEPALDRAIFIKDGEIVLDDEVESIRSKRQKSVDGLFREVFKC